MVMKWLESFGKPLKIISFSHSLTLTSNILTWVLSIEMPLMIWSPLKPQKPSKNIRLESNAPPSPLMRQELKNLAWRRCGKVQMVRSETSWMELSSENPLLSRISQDLFQDGKSQLSSEDMPSEINIKPQISQSINLEPFRLSSREKTELSKDTKSINSKERVVLDLLCTILMQVLNSLLTAALSLLFQEFILCTWPLKIPSWKNTMVASRISSKKFTKSIIKNNSKKIRYGMSIVLLMIWSLIWLNLKEDMYGLARTTTEMFKAIASLKVILYLLRLWIIGLDDFSATCSWWISWSWGCSRNCY